MVTRKILWVTASLTAAATLAAPWWGVGWATGLWIGALWGLLNAWMLTRVFRSLTEKRKGLSIALWLAAKFVGLYGLLFYLLVGLHISPGGWLVGFTLSLAGLGLGWRQVAL